jgi:radical SAM superfamily enzyme YgiQ (UPF0313 family)
VPFLAICQQVLEQGKITQAELPVGAYTRVCLETGQELKAHRHEDVNDLPLPDLTLLGDYKRYRDFLSNRTMGILTTSRGCPFVCHYCWSQKSVYRGFSIERTIETMRLYRDMGVEYIEFWDETFNPNKKRLRDFADALYAADLGLTWSIRGSVVQHVEPETIRILKKTGLRVMQFGVESANADVLKFLNKRIDRTMVKNAIETCESAGVRTVTNMIVGIPGQTREQIAQDFDFLREIRPTYIAANIYNWAPGTTHYENALKSGQVPVDKWREFAQKPTPDFSIFYQESPLIPFDEITAIRDRYVFRHYFNFGYIIRYLKRMDWSELARTLSISTSMFLFFLRGCFLSPIQVKQPALERSNS